MSISLQARSTLDIFEYYFCCMGHQIFKYSYISFAFDFLGLGVPDEDKFILAL